MAGIPRRCARCWVRGAVRGTGRGAVRGAVRKGRLVRRCVVREGCRVDAETCERQGVLRSCRVDAETYERCE
jgi:hypothetical protein